MPDPFLSVVIPVGPEESEITRGLIDDLHFLPKHSEIIFVGCDEKSQAGLERSTTDRIKAYSVQWAYAEPGRAKQMNAGAKQAAGQYIWFLHIDSRFSPKLIDTLVGNLRCYPERLHYCLLAFMDDGPSSMEMNSLGANLRSLCLGVPFGDQGLLISKQLFAEVGGYPETAPYGEDHLFVWYARQHGIRLKCCRSRLLTSARKYKRKGWLPLTLLYQKLWIKQAWPEFLRLLKRRYF